MSTTTSTSYEHTESTAAREPSIIESMAPLALILAVFYFLIIRPQQKKIKEHQNTVASLKSGDRVVMSSGIIGNIVNANSAESEMTLEISDGVVITVRKDMITEVLKSSDTSKKSVINKTKEKSAKTSKKK